MDSNKMGRPRINLKEKSKELTEKEYYTINELASIMKVERRTIKRANRRTVSGSIGSSGGTTAGKETWGWICKSASKQAVFGS